MNVFFFQDLLEFLKTILYLTQKRHKIKDIVIRKGKTEIPFGFIISYNILSSYQDNNAWMTYNVKATVDKKMRMDVKQFNQL